MDCLWFKLIGCLALWLYHRGPPFDGKNRNRGIVLQWGAKCQLFWCHLHSLYVNSEVNDALLKAFLIGLSICDLFLNQLVSRSDLNSSKELSKETCRRAVWCDPDSCDLVSGQPKAEELPSRRSSLKGSSGKAGRRQSGESNWEVHLEDVRAMSGLNACWDRYESRHVSWKKFIIQIRSILVMNSTQKT